MSGVAAQRVYGALAESYDQRWATYVERSTRWALEALHVSPNARVLDVGCGTGHFLHQLRQQHPHVHAVGVDVTHPMLRVAAKRQPPLFVLQSAAEALPVRDRSFDAVVSTSALHYLPHPASMLREMRRVLVPDGTVVITDWCADYWSMRLLDWGLRTVLRSLDPAHHRVLRANALAELLRTHGFTNVSVERRKIDRFWGLMTVRGVNSSA